MPAHLDTRPLDKHGNPRKRPRWLTPSDIAANKEADRMAGLAAASIHPHPDLIHKVVSYTHLVPKIHLRMAAVLSSLGNRERTSLPEHKWSTQLTTQELMRHTDHAVEESSGLLYCVQCFARMGKTNPKVRQWLQSDCVPPGKMPQDECMRVHTPVRVNKQTTHHTHILFIFRGLLFCRQCGAYSLTKLANLARECVGEGKRTNYGTENVNRIQAGLLPRKVKAWPQSLSVDHYKACLMAPHEVDVVEDMFALIRTAHLAAVRSNDPAQIDKVFQDSGSGGPAPAQASSQPASSSLASSQAGALGFQDPYPVSSLNFVQDSPHELDHACMSESCHSDESSGSD